MGYLVATKTKVDVSAVKIPESINDKYFARVKAEKVKKEGDIFEAKKEAYKPSEQRKTDQAAVDAQVLAAIKAHKEGAVLRKYLGAALPSPRESSLTKCSSKLVFGSLNWIKN